MMELVIRQTYFCMIRIGRYDYKVKMIDYLYRWHYQQEGIWRGEESI